MRRWIESKHRRIPFQVQTREGNLIYIYYLYNFKLASMPTIYLWSLLWSFNKCRSCFILTRSWYIFNFLISKPLSNNHTLCLLKEIQQANENRKSLISFSSVTLEASSRVISSETRLYYENFYKDEIAHEAACNKRIKQERLDQISLDIWDPQY